MLYYKFKGLIEKLASCNGTFDEEVEKLVSEGAIGEKDLSFIVLYAKMHR